MSKLAVIQQYRYSPAAGGLFSFLAPAIKFIGKGLGIIKPAATAAATTVAKAVKTPVGQAALLAGGTAAASALLAGGRGASGGYAPRRHSRGITARELRGYRKVARLLHQEGMVSRRARGRH